LTKAQDELLRKLENGCEVTFIKGHHEHWSKSADEEGHYVVIGGEEPTKIWPSTFYGLYDQGLVRVKANGNYTVSEDGIRQIRSEN
jgi:hypothetical protein